MKTTAGLIFICCFCLVLPFCVASQPVDALPRSNPEAEGVASAGILQFLAAANQTKGELHSFMFLRHGRVIAEGWWSPYAPSLRHSLYSVSKTFTSTAVGLCIAEKKLALTDKVISFFPGQLPLSVSSNLAALTVEDLLTMSDGMDPEPREVAGSRDWIKAFLAVPVKDSPGSKFLYNSLGTFMLSAIIQKQTGQTLLQYLRSRLFVPLGIMGMDWEENMMGINTGGWGLRVKTEDMAKLGQLYLQKGVWNGQVLLPATWVEQATTAHILQHPLLSAAQRDSSDWEQGYGYQIWRSRHHSFRADGAFGQFILVMPDQDAVIAIQAETNDLQGELNLVWRYLLPAMFKGKLPANTSAQSQLRTKLSGLQLLTESGNIAVKNANRSMLKYFEARPNPSQIQRFSIQMTDSLCHLTLQAGNENYNLFYGGGYWKTGQTNKPGPSAVAAARENWAILSPYKIAGNFYWTTDSTLVLVTRYTESPHAETYTVQFSEGKARMEITESLDFGQKKIIVEAVQK